MIEHEATYDNDIGSAPVAIDLRHCAKTFANGALALEPTDLSIAAGETIVFLGPSGCGKTTTLRLIAGLEQPDRGGSVLFDGVDVTALPIERRHIGMVFQSYALFPNMTVAENIGYGLRIRRVPAPQRRTRIGEMLEMMRIGQLADRRIDQLSGGQRQRVALARALAVRPRAFLLDEPLTALDAKLRDTLRVEIDALLRSLQITTVYVTHDQDEAMSLGDRIVVMDHGCIAQIGRPQEIYRQPATPFVADFIGTMNRLTGQMDNGRFICTAGFLTCSDLKNGTREIMFRPEHAELAAIDRAGSLSGTVTAAFFLGDRMRLFIDVGDSRPVILDSRERRDFRHGERVSLNIDTKAILAF